MSYVAGEALLDRISEVLEQSKGLLRTVPALRFEGDLPPGLSASAEQRRALTTPRVFASVTALERSAASSPVLGNQLLYKVSVEVRIVRLVPREAQLDPELHREVAAQAAVDTDVVRQALEFPGNLLETEAGEATGLASGMLIFATARSRFVGKIETAQTLETTHALWGTLKVVPVVGVFMQCSETLSAVSLSGSGTVS